MPLTELGLPVDTTGSSNTGVALFNFDARPATVTIKLLDTSGKEISSTMVNLDAGKHLARFVVGTGQFFPGAANVRGMLIVSSTVPIAALPLRQKDPPLSYTSLPAVALNSSQTSFRLAHITNGLFGQGGFRTTFLLFNVSNSPASVKVALTKDDGSAFPLTITGEGTASTFNVNLTPRGSAFLQTDGSGTLAAGAATISSNVPIGAAAIFSVFDSEGRSLTEAGVGDSPELVDLTMPVDADRDFSTGVAFFNPGNDEINLGLKLLDTKGEIVFGRSLKLGGNNHLAAFVPQLFQGTANLRGSLGINASDPVVNLDFFTPSCPRIIIRGAGPPSDRRASLAAQECSWLGAPRLPERAL